MAAKQAKNGKGRSAQARRTSKKRGASAPKPKKAAKGFPVIPKAPKKDSKRERRIAYEVIVDCYEREEVVLGWYYYLEGKLQFPFAAQCIAQRSISLLEIGDKVEVIGMARGECENDMFVMIRREPRPLAVPLAQLKPLRTVDAQTKEAVADWHYWLAQGRRF